MAPNKNDKLLTVAETARRLGVHPATVLYWIDRGHLPCVQETVTLERIPESALASAFDVTCRQCGKVFTARHPLKARFCSAECKADWHSFQRRGVTVRHRRREAAVCPHCEGRLPGKTFS